MITEKSIAKSRTFYILEAALEYFISILVAGSYLATLTSHLGMSDSLTGILSSFISLGCLFQLFSVFLKRRRVKTIVTVLSVVNQLLFMLLYIIPLGGGEKQVKIVLFMAAIFLAYLIYNSVHPLKINWLMSLVEDSVEIPVEDIEEKKNPIREMFSAVRDKNVVKVTILFILWQMASSSAIPFYGTYLIKELGFSLQFVSILSIVYTLVRASVSSFKFEFSIPEISESFKTRNRKKIGRTASIPQTKACSGFVWFTPAKNTDSGYFAESFRKTIGSYGGYGSLRPKPSYKRKRHEV